MQDGSFHTPDVTQQMQEEDTSLSRDDLWFAASFCCFVIFIVLFTVSSGGWRLLFRGGTSDSCSHKAHSENPGGLFDNVCRGGGTESPRASIYDRSGYNETGIYRCACCGKPLFPASTKYNSGTGWPSFWAPLDNDNIGYAKDIPAILSTEVHCSNCGAHLGHVFGGFTGGGGGETNYRFCINGVCLYHDPKTELPMTTDIPLVLDTYLLLVVVVLGLLSACRLCSSGPRFARRHFGSCIEIKESKVFMTEDTPTRVGSHSGP